MDQILKSPNLILRECFRRNRRLKGLTLKDIAAKAHISEFQMAKIERNGFRTPLIILRKIADILEIDEMDLELASSDAIACFQRLRDRDKSKPALHEEFGHKTQKEKIRSINSRHLFLLNIDP